MTNEIEKVEKRSPIIYEITGRRAEPKRHMHDYRNRNSKKNDHLQITKSKVVERSRNDTCMIIELENVEKRSPIIYEITGR